MSSIIQLKDESGVDAYPVTGTSMVVGLNDALSEKQATLVSGTNIKTINNESLLGSGNITINADTSACELLANKVTSLSSSSTDVQYPSAKATYDAISAVTTESLTTSEIDTIWNNAS